MMIESGLSLAFQEDELPKGGGFYPPAAGLGNVLMERITRTGTHFQVRTVPPTHSKL